MYFHMSETDPMATEYRVNLYAVRKQLKRIPAQIQAKLEFWASLVEDMGLPHVRKTPGWHDEPLKGKRFGQRSIRLSKAYRAIYRIDKEGRVTLIEVLEVNKHEY